MKYVDLIIDTKSDNVDRLYSYISPDDDIVPGRKVLAPFSGSKSRAGYVFAVHDTLPAELEGIRLKEIISQDLAHSIPEEAVETAAWMRRRYFCRYIDAVACFEPIGEPPKRKKKVKEANEKLSDVVDGNGDCHADDIPTPTPEQEIARAEIMKSVTAAAPAIFLVHGVTGSGKTELYMRVAGDLIDAGKQVIVLVPEISLTPQLIARFTGRFGEERVAVLHSKLSKGERYNAWTRLKSGEASIAVGARSAVFAPFSNIGAVIVDEEHETSYKSDKAPKYDTIEVAIRRARGYGAVTLLGSATPSVVSMYRAQSGVYRLLTLTKRYNENPLPTLTVTDMRAELRQGNRTIFSAALYEKMEASLARGRQSILFLNRRGYSPFIACRECGFVMRCPQCGLSMTWHKQEALAICHFCGTTAALPAGCPQCGSPQLRHFGIGTEKVEELTAEAFRAARISRLDLDTAARKGSAARILGDFEKKKSDILIGTQMVAKGLDFANVDLVGVIAADISLNIPDFRSAERTFQLITQAAGRSGRGDEPGEVVVQTYMPDNYAIAYAARGDYEGFFETELKFRKLMGYPPFADIVQITVFSASEEDAEKGAARFRRAFLKLAGAPAATEQSEVSEEAALAFASSCLLGPQKAAIYQFGGEYRYRLYLKMPPSRRRVWEELLSELKQKINTGKGRNWRIILDVNPYSLL